MTFKPISFLTIFTSLLLHTVVNGLGSASTASVTYGTSTICGIIAGKPTQKILCYQNNEIILIQPNVSFEAISGGQSFFCGLRSGGLSLLCWDTNKNFEPKRIYHSATDPLTDLTVGDAQVCATTVNSGITKCWRGENRNGSLLPPPFPSPGETLKFQTITSGSGFSCGILKNNGTVLCWGYNVVGAEIQSQFGNLSMSSLVAGESHACGLTTAGVLICKGRNGSGQLDVPFSSAHHFSGLALGANFTCAIRQRNGLVVCWGETNRFKSDDDLIINIPFEFIVAGLDFVCGLITSNLTIFCWGSGWFNEHNNSLKNLPLGMIIPGPCVQSSCSICGVYPNSGIFCDGFGNICSPCQAELPLAVPLPPLAPPSSDGLNKHFSAPSKARNKLNLAYLIVGSVGAFVSICTLMYCLWSGLLFGLLYNRGNNSVQPTTIDANMDPAPVPHVDSIVSELISFSSKRQSSRTLRRDRSGSSYQSSVILRRDRSESSSKHGDRTEMFSLSELALATNNFSKENKIGAGSFGVVYKGKLEDGREVAIKRADMTNSKAAKKFLEKESAFDSELVLLSRLHHKHLVDLVGYCEENEERLLVYEYMSNGALHDHLHNKNNTEKSSSILNSWRMRIKIALDAARGIEYLHNYAVPPIIHRDIKSSNILLDANWTARVSDFGLSLMNPESEHEAMSTKAVGTVGYIDPEYYVSNVLTAKSDVYGLGVVLLELLTGKKAVFKDEDGGGPVGVVEFAGPRISEGELRSILDKRIGQPEMNEVDAVELMAYTAMHCVKLEGKERPTIIDIVANLERAFALCQDNNNFITLSFPSE